MSYDNFLGDFLIKNTDDILPKTSQKQSNNDIFEKLLKY
jgi:hypothetical protein